MRNVIKNEYRNISQYIRVSNMADEICEKLSKMVVDITAAVDNELANSGMDSDISEYDRIFVPDMKNYIEGYVSFPLSSNGGDISIVKVKKLREGYNVRVYLESMNDIGVDSERLSREDYLDKMVDDSRCIEFTFQFNAQRLFIGENNGCECCNKDNCRNRFANLCAGPMTDEQFEEYSQTSPSDKDRRFIGKSILAHIHGNIYIAINANCNDWGRCVIATYASGLNIAMFILYSLCDIIGYCSHVGNSAVVYPYAVDEENNYYLTIDGGALVSSLTEKFGVICDPYRAYYDKKFEKYNIDCYAIDRIYDHTTAQVKSDLEFISADSTITEIIGGLGPKSAAKTC